LHDATILERRCEYERNEQRSVTSAKINEAFALDAQKCFRNMFQAYEDRKVS
jgi:hypothetical protein